MDKIRKLLESPILEDIAIGFSLLIKKTKVRKHKDLEILLEDIEFTNKECLDLYVSRFNIYISNDTIVKKEAEIYPVRMIENNRGHKIIRL